MPEHHANPGVTEDQDDGARAHLEESIVNLAEQIRQGNVKYLQGQKMLRVAVGAERRRERQRIAPFCLLLNYGGSFCSSGDMRRGVG